MDASIVARLRVPLWQDGQPGEFVLTAGKVHNLRLAGRAFNGVEIPAGEILSFWKQLGRPSARRGYVPGREIREGCLVPTIGGGLCQISNTLATCAARAGFELVERHAHSARPLSRSGDTDNVDATVFWNYLDLRIRATVAWRVDIELTDADLVLTLRAMQPLPAVSGGAVTVSKDATPDARPLRDCLSCGEVRCFRHRGSTQRERGRCAWLLDTWTPESHRWLESQGTVADCMQPMSMTRLRSTMLGRSPGESGGWADLRFDHGATRRYFVWTSLRRAWWLRHCASTQGRRQASMIDGRRWLARAYAKHLRSEHTHLVIDQGLLPYLKLWGVLGGRTYEVLVGALPMKDIQRRLDDALNANAVDASQAGSLTDFRIGNDLVRAELEAMRNAQRIVTPHTEVANYWHEHSGVNVCRVPWELPKVSAERWVHRPGAYPLVVFPASALPRKGICELVEAVRGLRCRLRILGAGKDATVDWKGVIAEHGSYADDWLHAADVVVLPAHVEHSPRALLMAVAASIPIIATPACGISDLTGIRLVPAGDCVALRLALSEVLDQRPGRAAHDLGASSESHGGSQPFMFP